MSADHGSIHAEFRSEDAIGLASKTGFDLRRERSLSHFAPHAEPWWLVEVPLCGLIGGGSIEGRSRPHTAQRKISLSWSLYGTFDRGSSNPFDLCGAYAMHAQAQTGFHPLHIQRNQCQSPGRIPYRGSLLTVRSKVACGRSLRANSQKKGNDGTRTVTANERSDDVSDRGGGPPRPRT